MMSKVEYVVEFYYTPSPLRETRLRQQPEIALANYTKVMRQHFKK